ncbi:MAG: c-type cytochrome [Planctomycetota bacterium]
MPESASELAAEGEAIIARRACRACHRPDHEDQVDVAATLAPPLSRIAERRPVAWVRRFLRYPYTVRANQLERMPDLGLSDREVEVLALYLELQADKKLKLLPSAGPVREAKPRYARILNGRRLFVRYNCMNCHSLGKHQIRIQRDDDGNVVFQHGALQAPDLTNLWQRIRPEWLLTMIQHPTQWMPWARMPELDVTDEDANELAWYLMNAIPSPTTEVTGAQIATLLQQKCASCHGTDDPEQSLDLSSLAGLRRGAIDDLGNPRPTLVAFAENSPLLLHLNGKKRHPKLPAQSVLSDEEYGQLESWVLAGAPD